MTLYRCPFCKTEIEDGIEFLIEHRKSECEEIQLSKMTPEEKLLMDIFSNHGEKTMDTKSARRKTFDVEYVVVTDENLQAVTEWCGGTVGGSDEEGDAYIKLADANARNARQNKAFADDYVVQYGTTFKAYTKKAFYKSFDDIDVDDDGHVTWFDGEKSDSSTLAERAGEGATDREVARAAGSGQFISMAEAEANPETTVVETVQFTHKVTGATVSIPKSEVDDFEAAQGVELAPDGVDPKSLGAETPTENLRGL